uniref:Uncharacterized protein n=1 Tax=Megaselia scalaris TaxID=36166 RepID=T1GNN9_MEGSC
MSRLAVSEISQTKLHLMIEFSDVVRNCKNFLRSCDYDEYLNNPYLVKEVSGKLPLSKMIKRQKKASCLESFAMFDSADYICIMDKILANDLGITGPVTFELIFNARNSTFQKRRPFSYTDSSLPRYSSRNL